jgi:hypothetical protein
MLSLRQFNPELPRDDRGTIPRQEFPMNKLTVVTLSLAALTAVAGGCSSGPRTVAHNAQAQANLFDKLKPLAGTWESEMEGKKNTAIVSKITSNGSVFCETMFPGSDHEMTNMYHMDGGGLVLTHYCAMGNQPRMRCVGQKAPNVFYFAFDDATNVAPGQLYMGEMTLTIIDNNHIRQDWRSFKDGKLADHATTIDLWRKKS